MINGFFTNFNLPPPEKKLVGNYKIPKLEGNKKIPVCVDLGSAQGMFPLKNHEIFEKIYCFEGCYPNFLKTVENITKSNLSHKVAAFNFCVGSYENESDRIVDLTFDNTGRPYGNSFTRPQKDSNCHHRSIKVNLADIFKIINEDTINYLKCDIEGSEHDLLFTNNLSKIDVISIELHSWVIGVKKIEELIQHIINQGFSVIDIQRNGKEMTFLNGKPSFEMVW